MQEWKCLSRRGVHVGGYRVPPYRIMPMSSKEVEKPVKKVGEYKRSRKSHVLKETLVHKIYRERLTLKHTFDHAHGSIMLVFSTCKTILKYIMIIGFLKASLCHSSITWYVCEARDLSHVVGRQSEKSKPRITC